MARIRPEGPRRRGGRSLKRTPEAFLAFHRAATYGFEAVPREWCEAFYATHRDYLVARFLNHQSLLSAWPVATFETADSQLREYAEGVYAKHRRRWDSPVTDE